MSGNLQVMVVDDTITYRMILKQVVETIPGMDVVNSAPNGKIALAKIASTPPDLVLLDVEMPEMDGLTTLQQLRAHYPQVTVVMVSGLSRSNANIVMECLNAGALDFVTKPLETDANRARESLRRSLEPILSLIVQRKGGGGGAPMPARPVPTPPPQRPAPVAPVAHKAPASAGMPGKPAMVLIGSSTGGPAALTKVLTGIGGKIAVPILIVQHMPPVFTASLADQLTRASGIPVREARKEMPVLPGSAILAMGGHHMVLTHKDGGLKVDLNDGPKVNECRPAVDVLFMSVAAGFNAPVLSIILTGMGRDGANGVTALKRMNKTYCITQDKLSCVVYGMPRAVDELGISDESLPLDQIGERIRVLCG